MSDRKELLADKGSKLAHMVLHMCSFTVLAGEWSAGVDLQPVVSLGGCRGCKMYG